MEGTEQQAGGQPERTGPKPGEYINKFAILDGKKYSPAGSTLLADDIGIPLPPHDNWVRTLLFKTPGGKYFFQMRQPYLDGFIHVVETYHAMAFYTNYAVNIYVPFEKAFDGIHLLVEEA